MNQTELMTKPDTLFKMKTFPRQFRFNQRVVNVFDDMVKRSVPDYGRILDFTERVVRHFYQKNTAIYDLGCSTGNTLRAVSTSLSAGAKLIGVDSSKEMIQECSRRMRAAQVRSTVKLICKDLRDVEFEKASVVILNYTLHFLSLKDRKKLLRKIFKALVPGGMLILSDKFDCKNKDLHSFFVKEHLYFKRTQGYSVAEIKRKAASLAGYLVPLTYERERKLVLKSGFESCDSFYRWAQFCTFLAIKSNAKK